MRITLRGDRLTGIKVVLNPPTLEIDLYESAVSDDFVFSLSGIRNFCRIRRTDSAMGTSPHHHRYVLRPRFQPG